MDSYLDKTGYFYTYCHECEYGKNGLINNCFIGKRYNGLGCYNGKIMDKLKEEIDEIHNRRDTAKP